MLLLMIAAMLILSNERHKHRRACVFACGLPMRHFKLLLADQTFVLRMFYKHPHLHPATTSTNQPRTIIQQTTQSEICLVCLHIHLPQRFYCWPKTCECHFHFGRAKVLSKMQWGRKTTVSEKGTCQCALKSTNGKIRSNDEQMSCNSKMNYYTIELKRMMWSV